METRKCKKCPKSYPLTEEYWYVRKETGVISTHTCKECVKLAAKENRQNNRERSNATNWAGRIRREYGISMEEYTAIMSSHTSCTICTKVPTGKFSDKLVYDHCHTTGKFRGVLCNKCNVGLGALGDTAADLYRAYTYLNNIEKELSSNDCNT